MLEQPSNPREAEPGSVVAGKYRVERVIGEGAMGIVVCAEHLVLRERLALKFLRPHAQTDARAKARFVREAMAAASINNPHVARVTDLGELDSGTPYLVMEYLEGRSLDEVLADESPLPPGRACDLLLQACEGLASAHAAGVIHRDVKPSNFFLTRANDGSELLKALDFGISKLSRPTALAPITDMQSTVGSPAYMSPEQMRSPRNVDARTDVWSLGVILYAALTGQRPFQAPSLAQTCALVLTGDRPPVTALRPDLPPALVAVVDRCLADAPEERFADMAELAAALAPFGGPHAAERAARCARILPASWRAETLRDCSLVPPLGSDPPSTEVMARSDPPSIEPALPGLPLASKLQGTDQVAQKSAAPPAPAPDVARRRAWLYVGAGLGLAVLAAGAAWWALAQPRPGPAHLHAPGSAPTSTPRGE